MNLARVLHRLPALRLHLDAAGDLYVSDGKVNAGVNERLLFKVDKTTGNRTLITQDGFFEQPRGLLLIP